ncbi:MAG: hypothetical protein KKB13_19660 [Chloroflexi bacterium]|nr:hypothetical protein [Chloroflexota bacterium]
MNVPSTVTNVVILARAAGPALQDVLLLTRELPGPETCHECQQGGATATLFYPVRDDLCHVLGDAGFLAGECLVIADGEVVYHQLVNLGSQIGQGPGHDVTQRVMGQALDCPALIRQVARRNGYTVAGLVRQTGRPA